MQLLVGCHALTVREIVVSCTALVDIVQLAGHCNMGLI